MRITKFGHACVRIEHEGQVVVLDPGMFTDAEELWAAEGGVTVDGFDYQTIDDTRITDTRRRLHLLEQATGDYAPGPYEQLAAAYRRAGHEERAERVLMTRQIRRYAEAGPRYGIEFLEP